VELRKNHDGDTYRAMYIAKLAEKIYVLHCFKKKSSRGKATPQKDIEMILTRLKIAVNDSRKGDQ
jgi:phage-related protein